LSFEVLPSINNRRWRRI